MNWIKKMMIPLEIELTNGVSFRQLYWFDTNTFHLGAYGNKTIKEIIKEVLQINAH